MRRRVAFMTWPRAAAIAWGSLILTTWAVGWLRVPGSWGSVVVDGFTIAFSALVLWAMGRARRTAPKTPTWSVVVLFSCTWAFGQAVSAWFAAHVDDVDFAAYTSNMASFGIWGYLVLTLVVAPISEELLFRGVTQRALAAGIGVRGALVAQAVCFSVCHGTATHLVPTLLTGLLFGWIAARTGRLSLAMAAHAANNAVSLLLAGWVSNLGAILPVGVWLALAFALAVVLVATVRERARVGAGAHAACALGGEADGGR